LKVKKRTNLATLIITLFIISALSGGIFLRNGVQASPSGLVLYMPFEGDSTKALLDHSGNGNDAVDKGSGATWSATAGHDGTGAFVFNGVTGWSGAYIDMGNIMPLEAYTKVAWIKPSGSGCRNILSGNWSHAFWVPDGNLKLGHSAGWENQISDGAISNDVWTFVAATYDPAVAGGNLTLYKNGVPSASATGYLSHNAGGNPSRLWIGAFSQYSPNNDPHCTWNGVIDEVRIYNYALSPEQIMSLYNTGYDYSCDYSVRIMPLGDSITVGVGDSSVGGYRGPLYNSLTVAGYNIDFVGSQSDGSGFDNNHEGHSGWTTTQIRDNIDGWLVSNPADIVLFHIGTNDLNDASFDINAYALNVNTTLGKIYSHDPTTTVILAKIIKTQTDSPTGRWTATHNYNIKLETEVAPFWAGLGYSIEVVDMESALTTSDMTDQWHPSTAGYAKMAPVWYDALDDILPVCGSVSPPSGLILYMPFEGDATSALNDQSGNGNDAVSKGSGATWSSSAGYGGTGAFVFNGAIDYGVGAYIDMGNIMPLEAYTKVAWVKTYGIGCANILSGHWSHSLWLPHSSSTLSVGHSPGWDNQVGDSVLAINEWTFVAATYDPAVAGGTIKVYRNGVLSGSATGYLSHNAGTNPSKLWIGAFSQYDEWNIPHCTWNGVIDEVRIYDYALSQTEIEALYSGASSTSTSTGTVTESETFTETVTVTQSETVTQSDTVTESFTETMTEASTETVYAAVEMLSGEVHVVVGGTSGVTRGKPAGTAYAAWIDSTAGGVLLGMAEDGIFFWDSDTGYVDPSTGEPTGVPAGATLVASGGPLVNGPVNYYEVNRIAEGTPAYYAYEGGWQKFKKTSDDSELAKLKPTSTDDLFIIEIFEDSEGRNVILIYGLAGRGTLAGALYFVDNVDYFDGKSGFWIYEWIDNSVDGAQEHPDPPGIDAYNLVTSG
jgi:lysophospholipase L1-like esterase